MPKAKFTVTEQRICMPVTTFKKLKASLQLCINSTNATAESAPSQQTYESLACMNHTMGLLVSLEAGSSDQQRTASATPVTEAGRVSRAALVKRFPHLSTSVLSTHLTSCKSYRRDGRSSSVSLIEILPKLQAVKPRGKKAKARRA